MSEYLLTGRTSGKGYLRKTHDLSGAGLCTTRQSVAKSVAQSARGHEALTLLTPAQKMQMIKTGVYGRSLYGSGTSDYGDFACARAFVGGED